MYLLDTGSNVSSSKERYVIRILTKLANAYEVPETVTESGEHETKQCCV